jgi:hypothetical protein
MNIYRLSASEFRSWRNRTTRDELRKRIYDVHGITQVRAPSGRILGTARRTSDRVPIEQARVRGAHHAVSPTECLCREWQKPEGKDDEHHPICLKKAAWEAQLAHSPDVPRERALLTAGDRPAKSPAQELPAAMPVPEACVCRNWAGAEPGAHHRLCEFRERWDLEHKAPAPLLVELETGNVVREALPEEVEASRTKEAEDGVGTIELSDGKLYYVRQP